VCYCFLCRADVYWKNVVSDLAAYAKHANRQTIHEADVELLLKRSALHHHKTYYEEYMIKSYC